MAAEHESPCAELKAFDRLSSERFDNIMGAIGELKTMVKESLDEGANRETRLQKVEDKCATCDKRFAAQVARMWGLLLAMLGIAGGLIREYFRR